MRGDRELLADVLEANLEPDDEAIRYPFKKAKRMERSHFGSLPELESFRKDEIDRTDLIDSLV